MNQYKDFRNWLGIRKLITIRDWIRDTEIYDLRKVRASDILRLQKQVTKDDYYDDYYDERED